MAEEVIDRQTDVFCDLAQQDRRYVAALVKGRCRALALTFPKLLV
jgi:ribonuclease PH